MSTKTNTQKKCLNCGTELHGKFCHACGQKASIEKPTIKEFILEYLNIAFVWDTYLVKTLKQLLRRPGHLTNEYMSGKFISYMHPLKLNMFLLFIFITFFLLFHNAEKMGDSINDLTYNDAVYPVVQMGLLIKNEEYAQQLESSRRDTVQLYSPLLLAESYPELVTVIDAPEAFPNDSATTWTAALPHKLIEDKAIIRHAEGHYYFNTEHKKEVTGLHLLGVIWKQMIKVTTNFFPLLILLTAPFLSLLIRLLQRKGNHTHFKHFIFSLHYTAFLEVVILFLYVVHLIASPPSWTMQSFIILSSCTYLTMAFRRVYETRNWFGAISQSVLTNLGYMMILAMLFIFIFFTAIVIVVIQHS